MDLTLQYNYVVRILAGVLINPLNPELNPICYLLALLAHQFLHVSRIRVKSLTLRLLMLYIYIYIYNISSLRVKTRILWVLYFSCNMNSADLTVMLSRYIYRLSAPQTGKTTTRRVEEFLFAMKRSRVLCQQPSCHNCFQFVNIFNPLNPELNPSAICWHY